MAEKPKGVNSQLETYINKMMKDVMNDKDASITDKVKVLDRALKLEQIKQGSKDGDEGSGFSDD